MAIWRHDKPILRMAVFSILGVISRIWLGRRSLWMCEIGLIAATFIALGGFKASGAEMETSSPACYQATGRIWVNSVDARGDIQHLPQHDQNFGISVSGPKWSVEFSADGYKSAAASDGTNAYYLVDLAKSRNANASISQDAYPRDARWNTRFVWMALASGSYFAATQNNIRLPTPWGNPRIDPFVYIFSSKIAQSSQTPFLPTRIEFIAEKQFLSDAADYLQMISNSKELERRESELKQLQTDYEHGFVGGEYSVLARTNLGELEIPTRFQLARYLPNSGLIEQYNGEVNYVTNCSEPPHLPEVARKTAVTDNRFRDLGKKIDGVTYVLTNGVWLPKSDEMVQAALARVEKGMLRTRRNVGKNRSLFITLICVLLLSPIPVLLLVKKTHNKNNETEKEQTK